MSAACSQRLERSGACPACARSYGRFSIWPSLLRLRLACPIEHPEAFWSFFSARSSFPAPKAHELEFRLSRPLRLRLSLRSKGAWTWGPFEIALQRRMNLGPDVSEPRISKAMRLWSGKTWHAWARRTAHPFQPRVIWPVLLQKRMGFAARLRLRSKDAWVLRWRVPLSARSIAVSTSFLPRRIAFAFSSLKSSGAEAMRLWSQRERYPQRPCAFEAGTKGTAKAMRLGSRCVEFGLRGVWPARGPVCAGTRYARDPACAGSGMRTVPSREFRFATWALVRVQREA